MVQYLDIRGPPSKTYTIQQTLEQSRDAGYAVFNYATVDEFALVERTVSDYLDIRSARNDGYPVSRWQRHPSRNDSVMLFSDQTVLCGLSIRADQVDASWGKTVFTAVRDSLDSLGLRAVFDQQSNQSNDIILDGKKVAAYTSTERNGWYHVNWFVALQPNYEMASYVSLPNEKFAGKYADTVTERIGGLHDADTGITAEDVRRSLRRELSAFDVVGSFTETSLTQSEQVESDSLLSMYRSDSEVYKR